MYSFVQASHSIIVVQCMYLICWRCKEHNDEYRVCLWFLMRDTNCCHRSLNAWYSLRTQQKDINLWCCEESSRRGGVVCKSHTCGCVCECLKHSAVSRHGDAHAYSIQVYECSRHLGVSIFLACVNTEATRNNILLMFHICFWNNFVGRTDTYTLLFQLKLGEHLAQNFVFL